MERHSFDGFSFVCGVLTLGAALLLLTGGLGDLSMRWVGPGAAIGLGLLMILAAWSGRPARAAELETRVGEPASADDA